MKTLKIFLAGLMTGSFLLCAPLNSPAADSSSQTDSSEALELARKLNHAFIAVAEKVSPAVVVIEVIEKPSVAQTDDDNPLWDMIPPELRRRFFGEYGQPRGNQGRGRRAPRSIGRGSGIVITEDGYILTNNHVVENAEKITVRFKDSRSFTAEVKGRDPLSDLAVIKINAKGLVPAKLGDSDATRVGEFAIAIGAPFFFDYSVTIGHVSAKGRQVIGGPEGAGLDQNFLQTDASINPGNSGGPLVNLYSEVIGINSMIAGMNTGIGFAVPINLAKKVIPHLIEEGKFTRARVGIEIVGLKDDPNHKVTFPGIEEGVEVRGIAPDGPASKTDLKPGDIITGVDGEQVETARELKEEIAYKKVGETITLDVARVDASGKIKNLKIKIKTEALSTGEDNDRGESNKNANSEPTNFGLSVKPMSRELAEEFGIEMMSGLVVTDVEPGSPADKKEIKPGDVITEVNRRPVSNMKQFREALASPKSKNGVVINFDSDGTKRFTVLKEEE